MKNQVDQVDQLYIHIQSLYVIRYISLFLKNKTQYNHKPLQTFNITKQSHTYIYPQAATLTKYSASMLEMGTVPTDLDAELASFAIPIDWKSVAAETFERRKRFCSNPESTFLPGCYSDMMMSNQAKARDQKESHSRGSDLVYASSTREREQFRRDEPVNVAFHFEDDGDVHMYDPTDPSTFPASMVPEMMGGSDASEEYPISQRQHVPRIASLNSMEHDFDFSSDNLDPASFLAGLDSPGLRMEQELSMQMTGMFRPECELCLFDFLFPCFYH